MTQGQRIGYSAEGVRVLCKPGDKLADNPNRQGVFMGMITEKVAKVLWDDRRSINYYHIDFLTPTAPLRPASGDASPVAVGDCDGCAPLSPLVVE